MAAKKKTSKKTIVEPVSEGVLSYSGKATISLMRGKKTYRKFSTHNAGCMPLFKFIGRCLATDYDVRLTPYGIRLFHCDVKDMGSESSIFASSSLKAKTTTLIPKSSVSLSVDNKSQSVTASITFLIPFTTIVKDDEGGNVIAMYDLEHVDSQSSPSAFLRLAIKKEGGWVEDEDRIIKGDGKTNVKVVWNMTINNAGN